MTPMVFAHVMKRLASGDVGGEHALEHLALAWRRTSSSTLVAGHLAIELRERRLAVGIVSTPVTRVVNS